MASAVCLAPSAELSETAIENTTVSSTDEAVTFPRTWAGVTPVPRRSEARVATSTPVMSSL